MKLIIVAGGKGERLGLKGLPKPMVPFAGKPLLEHQIELAKRYGLSEIIILTGYMSDSIEDYFKDGAVWGVHIDYVVEKLPLGTAGAIRQLATKLNERFVVFYGDLVIDIDLDKLIEFDKDHLGIATLLVHPNNHPYDSDLIKLDASHRVIEILNKPHSERLLYRNVVNAGIYILDPEIFDYIPTDRPADVARDIFPALLKQGKNLYGYQSAEYVRDLGTGDRYRETERDFISGKVRRMNRSYSRKAVFLDRDGVLNREVSMPISLEKFELLDGTVEAIKIINKSEYLAIVVTNQPVLAKGFCTVEDLERLHQKLETELGKGGAFLDGLYYCPHHPEKGFIGEVKELKIDCECRKPKPGLFLRAAEDFNIDLGRSFVIGDRHSDLVAGAAVGASGYLVKTGFAGQDRIKSEMDNVVICNNLKSAVEQIFSEE